MARKQKLFTVAAARRRALQPVVVAVEPPLPLELFLDAARATRRARARLQVLEEQTVRDGRAEGLSWDQVGKYLAASGETLRRRYGGLAG
jgi:N-acyl-D-aspartate/D-glutamate deacylase